MRYVAGDVLSTLAIYKAAVTRGKIPWISKKGKPNTFYLGSPDFLPVGECLKLPEPDTSWMGAGRLTRESMYGWISAKS